MERHYTYTQTIFDYASGIDAEKFTFAILIGAVIFLLGKIAANKISTTNKLNEKLIPEKSLSAFSLFDLFSEFFIKFQDSVLGKENRRYFPLSATVFLFIFIANVAGLIPGFPAATTTVWVNVGIALVVFFAFNYYGVKENGVIGYLKHFCGGNAILGSAMLAIFIAPLLLALELLSTCLRVLTLNLRLYWNISADHEILNIFVNMLPIPGPVIFYGMGFFVSFMQAFVFTILTMVYVLLATQHEEEH